jgi:hypothetical protein
MVWHFEKKFAGSMEFRRERRGELSQPAFEACAALHEGGARLHLGARSAPLMYVASKGHRIPRFVSRAYVGMLRVDVAAGESWREQKQK